MSTPTSLLLLVFIHGFKGSSVSFSTFPSRLQSILTASLPETSVHTIVYPTYDTRGSLEDAVDQFIAWLTGVQVDKQMEVWQDLFEGIGTARGGGSTRKRKVKTILLAHSMGGLLAVDCATRVWRELGVIGVIAYDTPYFGLSHSLITSQGSKAFSFAQSGHKILDNFGLSPFSSSASSTPGTASKSLASAASASSSISSTAGTAVTKSGGSSWLSYGLAAGVAGLVAAGGAAYWQRKTIGVGMDWLMSHVEFVGELYKQDRLKYRTGGILESVKKEEWGFHCFYVALKKRKDEPTSRTFIAVPKNEDIVKEFFEANFNGLVDDEINGHMSIFEPETNDGCYKIGLRTIEMITHWIDHLDEDKGKDLDEEKVMEEAKDASDMMKEGMRAAAQQTTNPTVMSTTHGQ